MRKDSTTLAGTIHRLTLDSAVLKGNLLGDPTLRAIDVYVPNGHDGRGLPLLVDLVGFTAGGPIHTNWKNFGENVPERLDRLIATGAMPPSVVAFPDCFTKLGGNQYVNSSAMGRWDDFLLKEAIPFVESKFGCGGAGRRGVFGKSSGGYGAIAGTGQPESLIGLPHVNERGSEPLLPLCHDLSGLRAGAIVCNEDFIRQHRLARHAAQSQIERGGPVVRRDDQRDAQIREHAQRLSAVRPGDPVPPSILETSSAASS